MKNFVLEFVGFHTDGHFDTDAERTEPGDPGFNGKRQVMQFAYDTDDCPDGPSSIASDMRARYSEGTVLLHDAEAYLIWLKKTAKRIKRNLR